MHIYIQKKGGVCLSTLIDCEKVKPIEWDMWPALANAPPTHYYLEWERDHSAALELELDQGDVQMDGRHGNKVGKPVSSRYSASRERKTT